MEKNRLIFGGSIAVLLALGLYSVQNQNIQEDTTEETVSSTVSQPLSSFVKEEKKLKAAQNSQLSNSLTVSHSSPKSTDPLSKSPTFDVYQTYSHKNINIQSTDEAKALLVSSLISPHRQDKIDFIYTDSTYGGEGSSYYHFTQTLNGVPVEGAELVVQINKDLKLQSISGKYDTAVDIDTSATLSADQTLKDFLVLRTDGNPDTTKIYEKPELVVFTDRDQNAHLTYRSKVRYVHIDGGNAFHEFYLDANNGTLVKEYTQMHSALNVSVYEGVQCEQFPGELRRDDANPIGDKVVDKAYDFLADSYNFYKLMFNRDSYDLNGGSIKMTVNAQFYDQQSRKCNGMNAFYTGQDGTLLFGAGDSSVNQFASAPDIVAHELTHAVTDKESKLKYEDETGALNEALSDMFGVTVQAWAESGGSASGNPSEIKITESTWLLGEALDAEGWERYMDNPTKDGRSYDNYEDRGTANSCSQQNDNCYVHTNSGIYNLSYSLLATGGTHPKDKSDIVVPGIGLDKAVRIWYEAQINTIGSSTGFTGIRNSIKAAATGVYGECSPEYKSAMLSLDAVLIPGSWECAEPDVVAPTVVSITPVSNTTDISITPTIRVKFSEPIKIESVNSTNVVLQNASGTKVASSLNVNGETVNITPSSALAYESVYTLSISGVTDVSDNSLDIAFNSSFTTKIEPDNSDKVAPTVVSYTPESSAVDISVDSDIEITFSEEVNLDTLKSALSLKSQSGTNVNISVVLNGEHVTVTPDSSLRAGTVYTMSVENSVKDLSDNTLASRLTWTFTTYEEIIETPNNSTSLSDATITSGSYYNSSYIPENMTDGNAQTGWVSQTLVNGYYQSDFIQVAFDTPRTVNNLYIDWNTYYFAREMEVWIYVQNQWYRMGTLGQKNPGITTLPISGEVSAIYVSMRGGNQGAWFAIDTLEID